MTRVLLLFGVLFGFMVACRSQTNEEKMKETSGKAITAIRDGKEGDFEDLIGVELKTIGLNKEMLGNNLKKCKTFYDRYLAGKQPNIIITNEVNSLGKRKVVVPFYRGYDSVNKVSEVRLELYFGPTYFVPLSKLSGYELIVEADRPTTVTAPPVKN
jgi:hypothetical protein